MGQGGQVTNSVSEYRFFSFINKIVNQNKSGEI